MKRRIRHFLARHVLVLHCMIFDFRFSAHQDNHSPEYQFSGLNPYSTELVVLCAPSIAFYCDRSQSSAVQTPRSEHPANISVSCRVAFCQCNKYNYLMKICERNHPDKPKLLDNGNDYLRELVCCLFTLCLWDST